MKKVFWKDLKIEEAGGIAIEKRRSAGCEDQDVSKQFEEFDFCYHHGETAKDVKRKIKKQRFSCGQTTKEEHRRVSGNCEVDISFQYLKFFFL